MSTYTGDMKTVINTYIANTKLEDDNYYLFLVPKGTNMTEDGYMPGSKLCGFIFIDAEENDPAKTVRAMAHELGHGAFTLKHTFSDYPALVQGSTDNLMDYGSGTTLLKYQWDVIHNPRIVLGVFESDGAGASKSAVKATSKVILSDSTMKSGHVFIYNSSDHKIKLKFEIADTTKSKVPCQLAVKSEASGTTFIYPKAGSDTLIYNLVKEVTLDSIPQGRYTFGCKTKKAEYKTDFFIRKKKLEVTAAQLKKVFDTDTVILGQIAKAVNTYGINFGITTTDRMCHFLAQTGYESTGFKAGKGESACYPSNNPNWNIWFGKTWGEPPFGSNCDATLNPIVNNTKKLKWTAVTCDSTNKACVAVPVEYVCSATNVLKGDALAKKFFSYVYQCEGGNGNSEDGDGYKYRGHGAIQLTWKKSYVNFDAWLKKNYKGEYKNIVADPTLMDSDKQLFILSAMWYWGVNNINKDADEGSVRKITLKINSAGLEWEKRGKISDQLKKEIN